MSKHRSTTIATYSLVFTAFLGATSLAAPLAALGADPTTTTEKPIVKETAQFKEPVAATKIVKGIRGMWVWRSDSIKTPEARKSLLDFAAQYSFNRLLLQIHYVPGSIASGKPEIRDADAVKALLVDAAAKSIRIEALDGSSDMGRAANHAQALSILDAIIAFDATLPSDAKFAGIHYDIEPYILPAWKTPERHAIMIENLTFMSAAKEKLATSAPHWTLSCDIPFWYGHKTKDDDTCIIEFGGQTKNFQDHLQDLTDYVDIMSYRRNATGPNSVASITEDQLAYAAKIGKTVCPSFEVGQLKETPKITFFGTPPAELWAQKKLLEETLKDNPGFGGVLVHSYEHLKEYVEQTAK